MTKVPLKNQLTLGQEFGDDDEVTMGEGNTSRSNVIPIKFYSHRRNSFEF